MLIFTVDGKSYPAFSYLVSQGISEAVATVLANPSHSTNIASGNHSFEVSSHSHGIRLSLNFAGSVDHQVSVFTEHEVPRLATDLVRPFKVSR